MVSDAFAEITNSCILDISNRPALLQPASRPKLSSLIELGLIELHKPIPEPICCIPYANTSTCSRVFSTGWLDMSTDGKLLTFGVCRKIFPALMLLEFYALDEVIRKRLLIDGDGGGDERRFNTLMKLFIKWCNSDTPDTDRWDMNHI